VMGVMRLAAMGVGVYGAASTVCRLGCSS
jgi:hypothetical protein